MNYIWALLASIAGTIISFLQQGPTPKKPVVPSPTPDNPTPAASNLQTVIAWMDANEINLGPMPGTGGVIHKDTAAMTAEIAGYIIAGSKKYTLTLSSLAQRIAMMVAWIRCESDFDPKAEDPNDESLPKNATALQIIQNSDLGIAQFSYRTLAAMADLKGMSPDQIVTQAEDPEWATDAMFAWCNNLLVQAKASMLADPSLAKLVPNGDYRALGIEAYNVGLEGATAMARKHGRSGNWAYAQSVLKKYDGLFPLFVNE